MRDEQLANASERPQPIALMHLRKGLVGEVALPLADDGRPVEDAPKEKLSVKPLAGDFGISMDAQRLLSRVRTDLDSFSDTEAFALMLDAYSMTDFVLNRDPRFAAFLAKSPPVGSPVPERWDFRVVEEQTGAAILPADYRRRLAVARQRFFKPISLVPHAVTALKALGAAILIALVALLVFRWTEVMDALSTEWPIWWLLVGLGFPLLLVALYIKERGPFFVRWPGLALVSYLMPIVFAPVLWLYSLFAVYVTTPIFNRLGRVPTSSARGATRHGSRISASMTLAAEIAVAASQPSAAADREPRLSSRDRVRSVDQHRDPQGVAPHLGIARYQVEPDQHRADPEHPHACRPRRRPRALAASRSGSRGTCGAPPLNSRTAASANRAVSDLLRPSIAARARTGSRRPGAQARARGSGAGARVRIVLPSTQSSPACV